MSNTQDKGITLVSVIIIMVCIILVISIIFILSNGSDNKEKIIMEYLETEPKNVMTSFVTIYSKIVQTGDKKELYVKLNNDIIIEDEEILKKEVYYLLNKNNSKMKNFHDVKLKSGQIIWYILYENGNIEKVMLDNNVSKNTFIATHIQSTKAPNDIFIGGQGNIRDGVSYYDVILNNRVTGEELVIETLKLD